MLIDSATDAYLWAEKYTGTLEDVFALQEQMSCRIVEGLRLKLTPEEDRRLAARPIPAGIRSQEKQLATPHSVDEKRFERFKIEESGRDPCGRTNVRFGRESPGCGLPEVARGYKAHTTISS